MVEEGRRYHDKTGIHPIDQVMVVRRTIVEQEPELPVRLMAAFETAERMARRGLERDVEV